MRVSIVFTLVHYSRLLVRTTLGTTATAELQLDLLGREQLRQRVVKVLQALLELLGEGSEADAEVAGVTVHHRAGDGEGPVLVSEQHEEVVRVV